MSPTPTPGRVVLYVLPNDDSIREHARGKIRPARVIGLTNDVLGIASYPIEGQVCQLMVDLDGTNDVDAKGLGMAEVLRQSWRTSVPHDQEGKAPGTWHWMEYQLGQAAKTEDILKVAENAYLRAVETLSGQYDEAIVKMREKITGLETTLAALNAKQPERQRLDVTDPTPVPPGAVAPTEGQTEH